VSAGRTRQRPRPPQVGVNGSTDRPTVDRLSVEHRTKAERRLRARARRRRLRRWVAVAVPLAVVALVGATAWVLLASPFDAVTTVQVVGTHRLTADQVRQAADIPVGRSLLRLDLSGAEQRVEQLRVVRSATVTTTWPHTVVVTVVERVPVATAQTAAGSWWLLDQDGVAVTQASSRPPGLVLVRLDPTTTAPSTITAAAAVAAALPASLRAVVTDVTAQTPDSVRLDLVGGGLVRWGSAQDSATKAQVLTALLPHHAHVYDVTAPGFATTS
jgi:cell division protein FtsQ